MIGGDGGQTLRQQVVVGIAGFHFDHFTLPAKILDRLDQQEPDPVILSLGQPLEFRAASLFANLSFRHACTFDAASGRKLSRSPLDPIESGQSPNLRRGPHRAGVFQTGP